MNLRSYINRATATGAAGLLVLCALAFWGCNRNGGDAALATVNGKKILTSEVDKYYQNQVGNAPQQLEPDQANSLKLSILRQLIDDEIMMQRAEKLNLVATDEDVDAKITELKAGMTKEEFDRRLKDRKLTIDDLKNEMRRNLTVDKVINKEINSKINVSDSEVEAYYNSHKAEFNVIEPQYHLAQIVVTGQNLPFRNLKNDKASNDADARKKIDQLRNRLESGEDFTTVAMNYSEDPNTSTNGGDMGFLPESSLKPPQVDAAISREVLSLQPGHMTKVVASSNRYYIIKLLAKEPAGQRDLNDPRVKQAIREQLKQRREQLLKAAYYEALHNDARVENFLAEDIMKTASK